ncbi:MAG TPA: tetratricopeptide repeat protein [Verrucomicrobiae bacterium]
MSAPVQHGGKKANESDARRTGASPTGPPSQPTPAPALSTGRKVLFRIVGALVIPSLRVVGLESALRLGGYGYSPEFFKQVRIGSEDYLVDNDKFGLRFFPPELARSPPPIRLKAVKPAGTFRIFVLGESAALGDPRPAYGAARYFQALLRERYPGTEFEVVCGAVTAINSHAVLPIARECACHQGDLWIVYMGNNEMIGPFGATTIFGSQSPPLSYVRLSLAVQRTRLGQLLMAVGRKISGGASHGPSWGGMKMFLDNQIPARDRRKEMVYRNFSRNLDDILRVGRAARVPMILSTVGVNLRDSPPFGSLPGTQLPAADQKAWEAFFTNGIRAEAEGHYEDAAGQYPKAASLDPAYAELQFRWADCLLRLTNVVAAREHFGLARDDDALPFRADSRINSLITEAGRKTEWSNLVMFDAAALFAGHSPDGIPGREAFYEHVHLNSDGNYLLAQAWAGLVEHFLPATVANRASGGWASQALCEQRLGLTDWNRYAVLEDVMRRLAEAPFTNQLNHTQRRETIRAELQSLRERMDASAAAKAQELYLDALKRQPSDHRLHENYAEFLEARGEFAGAAAEWEQVRELLPHHHVAYFQAGRLDLRLGKLPESGERLSQAVTLRPDLGEGWLELGRLHAAEAKLDVALADFERARQLMPQDARVFYFIGQALSKLNRRQEAIASFRRALQLRPNYWEARYALGEVLAFDGQGPEAHRMFEEVIRQKPDHAMAHFNLGVALWQEGRKEEALARFEECARLDPSNKLAREYVQKITARLVKP